MESERVSRSVRIICVPFTAAIGYGLPSLTALIEKRSLSGQFRFGGEIHQWMYDRYSLGRLLEKVGFKNIVIRSADTSYIDKWKEYKLDDISENASLFIEAIKQ